MESADSEGDISVEIPQPNVKQSRCLFRYYSFFFCGGGGRCSVTGKDVIFRCLYRVWLAAPCRVVAGGQGEEKGMRKYTSNLRKGSHIESGKKDRENAGNKTAVLRLA